MEILKLKITGTAPLMMHADTFANPLHPATKAHKELTSIRKKSDEVHEAIAKSEFIGGCYWSEDVGFYIPGANLDATFLAGAKLSRLGTHWKRGALVVTDKAKLIFDGPKNPEKLLEVADFVDCRGVKVGAAKIMRYRPVFRDWAVEADVAINTDVLNINEAKKSIEDAGALIGTCEYRPRFGRFGVSYG